MEVPIEDVDRSLEDVDFLVRSANRVVVLDALTDGPVGRGELAERTGVSKATLGRILEDFEERNWIRQDDREYRTTPVGSFIVEKLAVFLEQMATARTLAPVMQWVPADGLGFDLRCLRDVEIVYSTETDPFAPVRRVDRWLRSGDRIRLVSHEITASGLESVWKATVHGDQQVVAVFTPGVYDAVERDPEMLEQLRELLDAENAELYVYRENKPMLLIIANDTAGIGLTQDGIPRAVVLTDDETVYAWAADTFAEYRDRAEPFERETFTA